MAECGHVNVFAIQDRHKARLLLLVTSIKSQFIQRGIELWIKDGREGESVPNNTPKL